MALTDTQLKALKPRGKSYILTDSDGLYVEVIPTGGVCWRYRYRLHGKQEKVSIGRYPDLSLKAARQKRAELATLVAQGQSPAQQKQQIKAERTATLTVREFAAQWVKEVVQRVRKNSRTIELYLSIPKFLELDKVVKRAAGHPRQTRVPTWAGAVTVLTQWPATAG